MTIKGIIFDFDGVICDTETPEVHAWERLFADYGQIFPFERYHETIGAVYNDETPFVFLDEAVGFSIDRSIAREKFRILKKEFIDAESLRPGILNWLQQSQALNLKIGLASSSPRSWIDYHLERLSISEYFNCIKTKDDVAVTKPNPELFSKTIACMKLDPKEVIALEDSINGVEAGKKAGLHVIVFPNEVTKGFDFCKADLVVSSLVDETMTEIIGFINNL